MSIYTLLKKDHELVKGLLAKISQLSSKPSPERDSLFKKLEFEFLVHSRAEEDVFYTPLDHETSTKDEISHARREHRAIEKLIKKLSDKSLNNLEWVNLFEKMHKAILHHIDEEENEIFIDAKKELSQKEANEMEIEMKEEKKHLKEKRQH